MTVNKEYLNKLLVEMVKIDSTSSKEDHTEITEYMKNIIETELGFTVETIPYTENPKKHNIIAYKKPGYKVMLCGHLDTVDVGNNWKKDPFVCSYETRENQTLVFGRGTSDMKSGNAVMIATTKTLIEQEKNVDDIALFFSTEEELGVKGSKDIMKTRKELFETVETYIVLEPTNLFIGSGQNGAYWVKFTCKGKSAHGSNPYVGLNAIEGITDLNYVLKEGIESGELCGNVSINFGMIQGGSKVNIVPDLCYEWVDYRFSPNVFYKDIEEMLENIIHQMNEISYVQYEYEIFSFSNAFRCSVNNEYYKKLTEYMKKIERHKDLPMPYGSDGAVFKQHFPKADVLIFGPGTMIQMHTEDECVVLDDMVVCTEALASLF